MAYMSQELKAKLAPEIKSILKQYGLKGSISVRHHSTLVVTIREGRIDFLGSRIGHVPEGRRNRDTYIQVNHYHLDSSFDGEALECLQALKKAMNDGNYDHSDLQSDVFNVGWYTDINIGKWDKPYVLTEKQP